MKFIKFKGVVFDLDYTLYDEHLYFFAVFEKFCNIRKRHKKFRQMKNSFLSLRTISKDIFSDILALHKFIEIDELKKELFKIYISVTAKIRPYDDAIFLLNGLRNKDLKCGILTNGVIAAQKNKIRCLNISSYFDKILLARQLGKEHEKPDKGSFKKISQALNISPRELIFVGDNPNTDFKGAKEIGGFTIRLKRGIYSSIPTDKFIDVEIKDLRDVEKYYG